VNVKARYSTVAASVTDLDPNADPDPACHFDANPDPDPACPLDMDPDADPDANPAPPYHFDAKPNSDLDPSFQINAQNFQNFKKSSNIGSYSIHFGLSQAI
jgi:hypothetical protein